MDTSLVLPFTLWGLGPFVSKNYTYNYRRPIVEGITFYLSDDFGQFMRRHVLKADSLPITAIYSLQYPDYYTLVGFGFTRFINEFLLSFHYDYVDNFKQFSAYMNYEKFSAGYFDVFKMNSRAILIFASYGKSFISYQKFNQTEAYSLNILGSEFSFRKDTIESWAGFPFRYRNFYAFAGIYYTNAGNTLPLLNSTLSFRYFQILFKFKPYIAYGYAPVRMYEVGLKLLWNSSYVYLSNSSDLLFLDVDSFSYENFFKLEGVINTDYLKLSFNYITRGKLRFQLRGGLFYPYKPFKGVEIVPTVEVLTFLPDIFVSSFGISFNLFGGVFASFKYITNFGIDSLWGGDYYSIHFFTLLED